MNSKPNSRPPSGYLGSVHQFGAAKTKLVRKEDEVKEKRQSKTLSQILESIPPPPNEDDDEEESESESSPNNTPYIPSEASGLQTAFVIEPVKFKAQNDESPKPKMENQVIEEPNILLTPVEEDLPPKVPIRTTSLRGQSRASALLKAKKLTRGKSLDEGMPDLVVDATKAKKGHHNPVFPLVGRFFRSLALRRSSTVSIEEDQEGECKEELEHKNKVY